MCLLLEFVVCCLFVCLLLLFSDVDVSSYLCWIVLLVTFGFCCLFVLFGLVFVIRVYVLCLRVDCLVSCFVVI